MDKITDALLEAECQTPLILGISHINISSDGTKISITYEDDVKTYQKKQKEVEQKVSEIISSLISEGMSELEKELVIHKYMCEHISYDGEALENAKMNQMKKADKVYRDSFTAYGALINGKAVCAGYAGAFKLLADKAGLENIIVTGSLEGGLSHEWNKVNIDGAWYVVDVTNNDTQFYPNALLNLSDQAAASVLVEDKRYVIDDNIEKYSADNIEQEYYFTMGKYYDMNQIAEKIVKELQTKDIVNVRTDYMMTDEQFETIMEEVEKEMGEEKLGAGYWLGVIRVERKGAK